VPAHHQQQLCFNPYQPGTASGAAAATVAVLHLSCCSS
jgi:hypothetical protein